MSKKRRREQPTVDTQLVEIYENLANIDEKIRFTAAHTLLTRFISVDNASGDQLNEILRRLIRGLCSGRKAARLGFSIALTECLTELYGPTAKSVSGLQSTGELIETLKWQTHVGGNVSGQEERDHQFGCLFGAESIIKSGFLFQSAGNTQPWSLILDIIYELARKKPWLREECGFILFNAIPVLQDHDPYYAQSIIDRLQSNGLAKTPEGVAIWIAIQSNCNSVIFPQGTWHHGDPLNRKELSKLGKILNEAPVTNPAHNENEVKAQQNGTWTTKLHFAWEVILTCLLAIPTSALQKKAKLSKRISVSDFWLVCVDNTLFAHSSSLERKYWGFLLFQRMVKDCPESLLSSIFTLSFMRCLMNQLAGHERFLHVAAEKATKVMLARARSDPTATRHILEALLIGSSGDINYDTVTKTKTIESLLSQTSDSALREIVIVYRELILRPDVQDIKEAAARRQVAADQLLFAFRSMAMEQTESEGNLVPTESVILLFSRCAYFDLNGLPDEHSSKPSPPISQASREIFRLRISSCLAHLLGRMDNPARPVHDIVSTLSEWGENNGGGKLLLEADNTVRGVTRLAWEILEKVSLKASSPSSNSSVAKYFCSIQLLYSLTLLQVYNEDADAVNMLEELNDCFEGLNSKESVRKGSAALIEVLLSFASKPSQLFRRLTQQVFAACASGFDEHGLQSMISVLETQESLSGQAEIFDQDVDMDGATEASDVDEVDMTVAGATSSSAENGFEYDNTNSSSDSADDSDGPDEELAAFDAKLAQALGTRPGNADRGAESSSSSDEDMDDKEMEALDEHLEKVFQERKKITSKKTEKKDAKETIVNFKCRVLELLEIYVKQQHGNTLALTLLLPILTITRKTQSPLVSTKACNLMREYARGCKGDGLPSIEDADAVFDLLEAVHTEATNEGSNAHATACSQASLLLVRVLVAHNRECLRRVVKIYAGTQEKTLFASSCKVRTSFFTDWQNWCAQARK